MDKETIFGLIRHALTAAGGVVTSYGYIGASEWETAVGAAMTLLGVVWSAMNKKDTAKKIKAEQNRAEVHMQRAYEAEVRARDAEAKATKKPAKKKAPAKAKGK